VSEDNKDTSGYYAIKVSTSGSHDRYPEIFSKYFSSLAEADAYCRSETSGGYNCSILHGDRGRL
jgi:hypothetical protein